MAAGTVVVTEEAYGSIKKITFAWTSGTDADAGTATKATVGAYNGVIERLVTVPGAAPNAPSDNYGVTVTDEDGVDVLMGAGLLRDTANTEQVLASSLGVVANDKLTVNVMAAGAAKKGTVHLYLR
jgi:hypothetical protein